MSNFKAYPTSVTEAQAAVTTAIVLHAHVCGKALEPISPFCIATFEKMKTTTYTMFKLLNKAAHTTGMGKDAFQQRYELRLEAEQLSLEVAESIRSMGKHLLFEDDLNSTIKLKAAYNKAFWEWDEKDVSNRKQYYKDHQAIEARMDEFCEELDQALENTALANGNSQEEG